MKKILSVIVTVTIFIMFAVGIVPAFAQSAYVLKVSTNTQSVYYTNFEEGWTAALDMAQTEDTQVTLYRNWLAGDINSNGVIDAGESAGDFLYCKDQVQYGTLNGSLLVTGKVNLTIDLNGYTISRGLRDAKDDGQVFTVTNGAKLTIDDTSENAKGAVTGGNNTGNGGGFSVTERATLTLNNGEISGNNSKFGGGVYVCDASFYMNGGSVVINVAERGGGIGLAKKYSADTEYIVCKGGDISLNNARLGGGVYLDSYNEDVVCTFENTEIIGNHASDDGGGVYEAFSTEACRVYFGKGTLIAQNSSNQGGGIYADCGGYTIIDARITNNCAYLRCGGVGVADDKDDNYHGNDWEYGVYTLGGSVYIQDNYVLDLGNDSKIASNLRIGDGSCDLYYDANNPFTEDTSIGIDMFSDFGRQEDEDKITDENGNFAIDSFKHFTIDNPDLVITARDSGGSEGADKYQLYVEFADAAADGTIKSVMLKGVFRTETNPVIDRKNKTITFTVSPITKKCLENCSLYGLADFFCGADWTEIVDGDKTTDLSVVNNATWKVMANNKSYELWQIKIVPFGGKWIEGDGSVAKVSFGSTTKYFADFESAWAEAMEAYKTNDTVFTLNKDWYAGDSDADGNIDPGKTAGVFKVTKGGSQVGTDNGRLYLDVDDYTLTIDLNGNTLSRNLSAAVEHGQVFRIASGAKLIIRDTSALAKGKITGGNNTGDGGAFYIDYGRLYLKGGEVSGNKAANGAGIYGTNADDTYVHILGGKISNNTASQKGGGVFMYNGCLYVDGGEITGNTASNGGGIYWESRDIFCLTKGTISHNMADKGAGVYATDWGDMYIGGTIVVNDNTLKTGSGKSNFYLEDNDAYLNNAAGQSDEIPNTPLTEGAYIGICGGDKDYCVSDSNSLFELTSIKYLHSDDASRVVRAVYDEDGDNHTYKIYYNDINNTKVKIPRVKTVEVGSLFLVDDIAFDYENQSILITSDISIKGMDELENNPLSRIAKITFDHEDTELVGFNENRDLTKPQQYMVMYEDGTYTLFTTSLQWACQHKYDENTDGICDKCGQNIFRIISYNAKAKEATVMIPKAGNYTLVFADYDSNGLENVETMEYTFTEGINIVAPKQSIALKNGDRIMLWLNLKECEPLCKALTLK